MMPGAKLFDAEFKKKLIFIIILALIGLLVAIFCYDIINTKQSSSALKSQIAEYESLLGDEQERKSQLEERTIYIQTKEYLEEKAREIGYVYPDEIIFKAEEE